MNLRIEKIATIAYSYKDTVYHTYSIAKELIEKNIRGCFVECGVAAGAQIMAMKVACDELKADRTIYGFDSFVGIPLAGEKDDEQPGIGPISHDVSMPLRERLVSSGVTAHSINSVFENFVNMDIPMSNIFLVEGWFQDTLPKLRTKRIDIAMLRLDGDLYESTMCCLENLYDMVVPGGVVIIDDYALAGANRAVHDFLDKLGVEPDLIPVPGSGGVVYFEV